MSEFRITEVGDREDWGDGGEYGPKSTFKIRVEGDQGRTEDGAFAELVQKRESAPPTAGQTINGSLVTERGRLRFKKDKPQAGGFKGGGGKSPAERAEIRRMAAQKAAVETFRGYVELAIAAGKAEEFKGRQPRDILDPLIAYFDEDVREAGERA